MLRCTGDDAEISDEYNVEKAKNDINKAFNTWRKALVELDFEKYFEYTPKKEIDASVKMAIRLKKRVNVAKKKSPEFKKLKKLVKEINLKVEDLNDIEDITLAKKLGIEMFKKMLLDDKMKEAILKLKNAQIKNIDYNKDKLAAKITFCVLPFRLAEGTMKKEILDKLDKREHKDAILNSFLLDEYGIYNLKLDASREDKKKICDILNSSDFISRNYEVLDEIRAIWEEGRWKFPNN
jgi:hypothetical protein